MHLIGARVGRFVLEKFLGEGSMGSVYVGYDEALDRRVAIKVLRPLFQSDATARALFMQEARLLSQLEHPAISRLYDIIEGDETDFLVLELIDGVNLREAVERGLTLDQRYAIAEQIAEGLVVAHGRGIVHRDLKPENVMITRDLQAKILDFGVARRRREGIEEPEDSGMVGTVRYMSPEQSRGEPAASASDMYSVGILFQELFTGLPAYEQEISLKELMARVDRAETMPLRGVDADLAALIRRLQSTQAATRPTADEVLGRLRRLRAKPARRRRWLIRMAATLVVFLAGILAVRLATPRARVETPEKPAAADPSAPLFVDPQGVDFSDNPGLRDRLRKSAHRYFRFINVPFSREVCRRFSAEIAESPSFNLHGDAHVVQYAVTGRGRGLTDYDDSSIGPGIIDLMRFGVSLFVACEHVGCDAGPIYDRFLDGYREALRDPDLEVPEPRLVTRLKAGFSATHEGFYRFVEASSEPMEAAVVTELTAALGPYFEAVREREEAGGGEFFAIESLGRFRAGVGSALELKYLVRVRGPSPDPLDDVVLEVKQVRDISGIPCISVTQTADPLRVLRGNTRIAYRPYRFLGYARFGGHNFWVHAWEEDYAELDIDDAFSRPGEVAEIAFDVGVQLGHGHIRSVAQGFERQMRGEQDRLIARDHDLIERHVRELAAETVAAWKRFVAEL